ncbi:hypothetical protein GWL_17090 [Herbaspirillum sp. GW103]|nr:hypothetical protein GWL_17090 [Herbaspirillum sp. GW103]
MLVRGWGQCGLLVVVIKTRPDCNKGGGFSPIFRPKAGHARTKKMGRPSPQERPDPPHHKPS